MDHAPTPAVGAARRRRTIAVTGSASGIGAAVVRRFERSGARVIGIDRRDAEVVADLSHPEGRAQAVNDVAALAGGSLDGAVCCAGLGPQVLPTESIASVNFFGALVVLDGLLAILADGEAAAAVAITSNAATLTPPDGELLGHLAQGDEAAARARAGALDGSTVYGTSKLALTRALRRRARAWGEAGVRLNAVAPGPVDTPLLAGGLADPVLRPLIEALPVPVGRRATPDEIAASVGFLLDPANGFVHGAVLFVDGGSDALLVPDRI
ncbi:MAG: SDR family oxidoreductase [Acidimicrobiales bacterium]|jgi:NAD(P)-dependent dehydrogenase (short-subunit alcohol dehydrogenase family)